MRRVVASCADYIGFLPLLIVCMLIALFTYADVRSDRQWAQSVVEKDCHIVRERAGHFLIPRETCWLCADGIERCR